MVQFSLMHPCFENYQILQYTYYFILLYNRMLHIKDSVPMRSLAAGSNNPLMCCHACCPTAGRIGVAREGVSLAPKYFTHHTAFLCRIICHFLIDQNVNQLFLTWLLQISQHCLKVYQDFLQYQWQLQFITEILRLASSSHCL